MTPCFADTFYFLALVNPKDEAHKLATAEAYTSRRPLVTTIWVLTEVADALAVGGNRRLFGPLLDQLRSDPRLSIIREADDWFERGVDLYRQRLDKEWSLTDCISFVVMREHDLTEALTADHHFEQSGFVILLK